MYKLILVIINLSEDHIDTSVPYTCRVHKRFREVSPDLVPKSMTGREPVTARVPLEKMEKLPELRVSNFHFLKTEIPLYIW